jgi:CHASE2 domain-containing sensor protein
MTRYLLRLRRALFLGYDRIGARLRNNFYLYAAVIFTLIALADLLSANLIVGMRNKSFDTMVRNRILVAEPAPEIVILDIDERSLAALAPEFGRWPWPRQVLAELVEKINPQQPQAIVFDILFSDADLFNPDSDSYFNEVIAASPHTWFPMVRLDSTADGESELKLAQLPGARPLAGADPNATIAAIFPYFAAIQSSGRVGFNNILPDRDGISREYPILHRASGYEIPSLPLAVVRGLDPQVKVPEKILLNWRGQPFTYPHLSFSDVFTDLRQEEPQLYATAFKDKIVIIGSTAPSLFDIKATAIDRQFPGVEILATAIDNLRHSDWLRVPALPFFYFSITLVILWLTAWGFYRHGAGGKLDRFYGLSQFLLIAIAYAAINLWNLYINLTGPVMFCFAYYSLARYYAFATARALDDSVAVRLRSAGGVARGSLLLLRFDLPTREEGALAKLAEVLKKHCRQQPSSEWLSGRQKGLWRLFENTLILCWQTEAGDDRRWEAIRAEVDALQADLPEILAVPAFRDLLPAAQLTISRAEGGLGNHGEEDWRALLGAALLHHQGGDEK